MGEAKARRAAAVEKPEITIVPPDHPLMVEAATKAVELLAIAKRVSDLGHDPRASAMLSTALQSVLFASRSGGTDWNEEANGLCSAMAWFMGQVEPERERVGMFTMMAATILADARQSAAVNALHNMDGGGRA